MCYFSFLQKFSSFSKTIYKLPRNRENLIISRNKQKNIPRRRQTYFTLQFAASYFRWKTLCCSCQLVKWKIFLTSRARLFMERVHAILNSLEEKIYAIYAWVWSPVLDAANTASHKLPLSIITQLASGRVAYTQCCPAETVTFTTVLANCASTN